MGQGKSVLGKESSHSLRESLLSELLCVCAGMDGQHC